MAYKYPAKRREWQAGYRVRNRERIRSQRRMENVPNPELVREANRRGHYKRKYGMTTKDKDALLAAQGGRCAICGTDKPATASGWHVDHCHQSKKVRGVLCQHCNNMLGMAKDSVEVLQRAIRYLQGEV